MNRAGKGLSGPSGWIPLVLIVGFLIPAAGLWAAKWTKGRGLSDQVDYHLPAILKFAKELPAPDLHDYLSATTPGYHLVLAVVARLVKPATEWRGTQDSAVVVLQVVGAMFTIALLGVFGWAVARAGMRRGRGGLELFALALPVMLSQYVFGAGVWLLPDNAGWVLVLGLLLMSLETTRVRVGWWAACAGLLLLTVLVRQSHLWVAAPVVTAAWLSTTPEEEGCLPSALAQPGRRVGPTLLAMLASAPAVVALAWFVHLWHGLTPPTFQVQHTVKGGTGVNWATVPFILSLGAIYSVFFVGHLAPALVRLWREARMLLVGAAVVACVWSILPETTYLHEPRASGMWNVVKWMEAHGMVIGHPPHTSPLIVVLATIGGPLLVAWLTLVEGKRRWIVAAAITAFMAAQSANANCWQRYHEPLLLMLFGLIAARAAKPEDGAMGRWVRVMGPLGLGMLLTVLTVISLFKGG